MMTEVQATAVVGWLRGHDEDTIQEVCLLAVEGKIRYTALRAPERYLRRVAARLRRNRRQHETKRRAWDQLAGAEMRRVQAPEQLRLAEAWDTYQRVERLAPTLLEGRGSSPAQRAQLYRVRRRFGITKGGLVGSIR